ncbi:MAG: tRNA (adenosine(37)-N6)-threonylcarbamoyltransferase complex dimerization subunit type 1 TsaB [Chloroflexi bacterium]|nr:tRNA (adenosine(37)-N6)-threonylcarbamoyltransferase complex dimerization subunit type 1 TsaB [Chloroflexota bacterium]
MQLAIDTSTDIASLALVQGDELVAELTWRCRRNHTVELLPRLSQLLEQSGTDLQSVTGITVAIGPGSYNGLRAGVSAAKGLAFSLEVPIAGISTLEAAAYQHAAAGLPLCPILHAGRGEVAAALYQMKGEEWRQLSAEHLTTIEALCSGIAAKTVFCGEFALSVAAELRKRLKAKAIIPSPAARFRRAGFLAELGQRRLDSGRHDDPATLQPLYLRRPAITEPKHEWRQNGIIAQNIS